MVSTQFFNQIFNDSRQRTERVYKPIVFLLCLVPFLWIGWDAFNFNLGANPVEKMTHRTGDWVLRFLLLTLAISPLQQLLNWSVLLRYRRLFGLFTFFYVCVHFLIYIVFDHFFDLNEIAEDIVKRPYITFGFTAFMLLIPLAVTSTNKMMKRLGKKWKKLHQLIYIIGTLGVLHYLSLVKADVFEPFIYGSILLVLLGWRAWKDAIMRKQKRVKETRLYSN